MLPALPTHPHHPQLLLLGLATPAALIHPTFPSATAPSNSNLTKLYLTSKHGAAHPCSSTPLSSSKPDSKSTARPQAPTARRTPVPRCAITVGALCFTVLCSQPSVPTCQATKHLIWGKTVTIAALPLLPSSPPFHCSLHPVPVDRLQVHALPRKLRGHR